MNSRGYNRYVIYSINHFKPEPIMLLILPIILSGISQNFFPLFLFHSHVITYYSCIIPQISIVPVQNFYGK